MNRNLQLVPLEHNPQKPAAAAAAHNLKQGLAGDKLEQQVL